MIIRPAITGRPIATMAAARWWFEVIATGVTTANGA
jgi:hypothetical protein